jgi:hypothetical protein
MSAYQTHSGLDPRLDQADQLAIDGRLYLPEVL